MRRVRFSKKKNSVKKCEDDAAIAHWIRLRLPSCSPGFNYQTQHLCFFQLKFELLLRKGQKDQKEVLVDPYLEQSCVPE